MKYKIYAVSFLIVLVLFIIANYYSYLQMKYPCIDCSAEFGFPFRIWVEGGMVGVKRILWEGLLADLLIASCAGMILGWVVDNTFVSRSRLP
jgi:hypothetical protein